LTAPQRRLLLLIAAAGLAAVAGAVVGAGGGGGGEPSRSQSGGRQPRAPARAAVDRLSLSEQVGQTIVFSFEGAVAPAYVRSILREGRGGGVILFGDNVGGAGPLRSLTTVLQRAANRSALIAVDQEGGPVRIIPFAAPAAAQSDQADPAAARAAAASAARDLARLGVNVNLAPVVDVGTDGGALAGRSFPGAPAAVAALAAAAVRGYGPRGPVAPTAKHFPGLGAAGENTDRAPVTISRTSAALQAQDLPPFRAAIDAGVPLVMASHALYAALDPRRIASQSPRVLRDLLRRRLGFAGAIVTDSIEAQAVLQRSEVATAAVRSIRAGADIVLSTGSGSYRDVYDALLAEAQQSPAFRGRVRDAAARVIALKRRIGLPAPPSMGP
jgi:beta-N-acetylhexosaminidase